jgi:hypothetical protein
VMGPALIEALTQIEHWDSDRGPSGQTPPRTAVRGAQ